VELRHLRYFVAVAEAGSMTVAADQTLHTAQPSLSRQMRDLEYQVGTPLLLRGSRGVELTAAGRAFLDHARLALAQVDAACVAARRAAAPAKASFALGFLTGQEMDWLPAAMQILRDELPRIEVTVSSHYSPQLADGLMNGALDLAFLRREPRRPDLVYHLLAQEPLVVVLASDHALASTTSVRVQQLAGETFINVSDTAPVLRAIIDGYLKRSSVSLTAKHEADNLSMAISLVASTRGVALLPAYAQNFLPWSVVSRPLAGEVPGIDLVAGYHQANASPVLKLFVSRLDELISLAAKATAESRRNAHPPTL
jgi:LysR family transcriptional regulator, hca operon transcriptional activator